MLHQISNTLRYDIKAMILMNNNLSLNPKNFQALDCLWDDKGNYHCELINEIIDDIRNNSITIKG
jgi:hypothetical protein